MKKVTFSIILVLVMLSCTNENRENHSENKEKIDSFILVGAWVYHAIIVGDKYIILD